MSTTVLAGSRSNHAEYLLKGDVLSNYFHSLFQHKQDDAQKKIEKRKVRRKALKQKGKDKGKNKPESSPDFQEPNIPQIELHGNASTFTVYSHVRQSVLEQQVKEAAKIFFKANTDKGSDEESDEDVDDKLKEPPVKVAKIVGIGLCGVFELIRESRTAYPELCTKALQALLDMLQGQQPEGLRNEPAEVIDTMYKLLMELAVVQGDSSPKEGNSLTALACTCLLSLCIARGDTGKLLSAASAMLMSPPPLRTQNIKVPGILVSLQRSVQAVLLGRTYGPDWLTCGIRRKALVDKVHLTEDKGQGESPHSAIASDGQYLYIHTKHGLSKVGSGYSGTIRGHVYGCNPSFHNKDRGWLEFANEKLFYRSLMDMHVVLATVNPDTLKEETTFQIEGDSYGPNVMFSDGDMVGHVAAAKEDGFVVRTFSPLTSPMPLVSELPLKLARKCMDVFGTAAYDPEAEIHTISMATDEDALSIASGREFALMRTASGKVMYTGKAPSLGIKQGASAAGSSKWSELTITKSPKIVQHAVGHDGQHGLLVADNGSVFFVGLAKRGEDGDSSAAKGRRQAKPSKPKKMIRLEGKNVVQCACNNGTSAVVTKEGELFMFGKDNGHTDEATGQVTDLKFVTVTQVSLGKAYAVTLTNKGKVWTFGINNKGQCGRDYVASKEGSMNVVMADDEPDEPDTEVNMCRPRKHQWKRSLCMICTVCGECTGYGANCCTVGQPGREPGGPCKCGAGDAGCSICGCCRSCAGETDKEGELDGEHLLQVLAKNKDVLPIELILGAKVEGPHAEPIPPKFDVKKPKAKPKAKANRDMGEGEASAASLISLPPQEITVGPADIAVTQVACGLHHSVALLENGDVYTWGSNNYGQLGQGDTIIRGVPTRVKLPTTIVQVAAGSHHTVALTTNGQVYTWGNYQKGQLGRSAPEDARDKKTMWYAMPGLVAGIGMKCGRRATWVGASSDQTFLRIDESLINAHTLARSTLFANQSCIGLIPTGEDGGASIKCLIINRADGSCKSFNGSDQADLSHHSVCLDPVYDVLWSYSHKTQELECYNVISSETRKIQELQPNVGDILSPGLAVPVRQGCLTTRSHSALHVLGCLDTLTSAHQLNLSVNEEEKQNQPTNKAFTKEDYNVANRFESHGGGWGYSGHSIEAVRFMADSDILLGGLGLFGGRGEYFGKIKLYELGPEGGDNESGGELLTETEEVAYECGPREKHPLLFEDPVPLQANHWYVAWARISGPSSDCGSSGQATVATDDQVIFKFKNSKMSNNGTDVNAGQIPQLLYRLPAHDHTSAVRKTDHIEPAHVLSKDFFKTVVPDCFEALLRLVDWSWKTFNASVPDIVDLRGSNLTGALADLDRLVYITTSGLRLVRTYICETYPSGQSTAKTPNETMKLAECVGEARALLRKILSENLPHVQHHKYKEMIKLLLEECHMTFTACFHAFYPTANLKWLCLCELLNFTEPNNADVEGLSCLLAAVMEALCQPTVKLTSILPINCEHVIQRVLKRQFSVDDNTNSAAQSGDVTRFPLLVVHMTQRTEMEGSGIPQCTFKEVLDKLLTIVVLPVRQTLQQERMSYPSSLVSNTCSLLACIISELAATATGSEVDVNPTSRPLLTTPNRFQRTSSSAYWNTGNGSPDAVCFSVDKPGIMIAGATVYGAGESYDYELELLDEQSEGSEHTQRWNTLEMTKGTLTAEDYVADIGEIKFDRPVPIKEGQKYAIRIRNHGPRTLNGDSGMTLVKCPDGTSFTFSACSLSSNGTNNMRGQIPQILYYSTVQEGENEHQNTRSLLEGQSRKNVLWLANSIIRAAADLLNRAQGHAAESLSETLGKAHIFSSLLPLVLAYIGPVASQDPRSAVQTLSLVQELLPPIAALNIIMDAIQAEKGGPEKAKVHNSNGGNGLMEFSTTSQHYAIVESDHPYKPAAVVNYRVTFPEDVKWMSLEFAPECGTAQNEDCLQLFIPARYSAKQVAAHRQSMADTDLDTYWPVLKKFYGQHNWPSMSIILPGNEVVFSLETASDYVKDDKACFYGFKCAVVAYEWSAVPAEGVMQLEKEVAYLGSMCAASLMRKDIQLPAASVEEVEEDLDLIDEGAQQVFSAHSFLLGKGLALSQPPSIMQALDGNLPYSSTSNERAFLKDFASCTPGTSGGRLARWLQPDSYLDPKATDIQYNREDLRCSWPAVITVQTKDQYAQLVHVPNLKVEVRAVPFDNKEADANKKIRRLSKAAEEANLTFGGHPAPNLDTQYEVTVKDKKDAFHAITMMKAYEQYSFEELRYAAPAVRRPSENMLVCSNGDGTYACRWTPATSGWYSVYVSVDGFETGEVHKMEVREPPIGLNPPTQLPGKKQPYQPSKTRKFVAQYSAGLRIRLNPSLHSEQIGIIKPSGIISFTDEIHNDDGVWLRLSPESIKTWCNNGYNEAWAMQYNQHLGKTMLVPVEEPKSILDEIIKDTILRRLPEILQERGMRPMSTSSDTSTAGAENAAAATITSAPSSVGATAAPVPAPIAQAPPSLAEATPPPPVKPPTGGPGVYQVVKCGTSGHNIRCGPALKATPIGMLVLGNQLTAEEDIVNPDGTWIKLDAKSTANYCHETDGEAWSLVRGSNGITYLQHVDDISGEIKDPFAFGFGASALGSTAAPPTLGAEGEAAGGDGKGFDFTSAQHTPFTFFGASSQVKTPFGAPATPSSPRTAAGTSFTFPKNPEDYEALKGAAPFKLSKDMGADFDPGIKGQDYPFRFPKEFGDMVPSVGPGRATPPQVGSAMSLTPPSGRMDGSGDGIDTLGVPGVSIKDLVKALDRGKDYKLRKLRKIGETKANGNQSPLATPPGTPQKAATPPGTPQKVATPPGTPKKIPSRSSSPKPIPGSSKHTSLHSGSPKHEVLLRERVSPSPPGTPSSSGGKRDSGAQWVTPPQTPPRFSSPPRGSPQRSSSSSPARSGSPHSSPSKKAADNVKAHFSIGAAGPREEAKSTSPKLARKDRYGSRSLRTKRERASSPSPKETPSTAPRSKSLPLMQLGKQRQPVKQALSPSVAECLRAVFASFLWHEGVVHDAMACASYLKFHPNLQKDVSPLETKSKKEDFLMKKDQGGDSGRPVKPSFPPDLIPGKPEEQNFNNVNVNINEAASKTGGKSGLKDDVFLTTPSPGTKERHKSESHIRESQVRFKSPTEEGHHVRFKLSSPDKDVMSPITSPKEERAKMHTPELLPTLQHLVHLWEGLSLATLRVIQQNQISASPAASAIMRVKRDDKKDLEKEKERKVKNRKREGKLLEPGRGNLFGEAAGIFGSGVEERNTVCELCGGTYPYPVTYHMRQSHPGCGRHAGGQGYNSAGHFCGGWAGNCGDGGLGGSSWYLMCDRCRDKYLREKKQVQKERSKKSKKKSISPVKQASLPVPTEPHLIMKNNAMFLLDLDCAAGLNLPSNAKKQHDPNLRRESSLPSVYEDSLLDIHSYPLVPFQYLMLKHADEHDSAFAEDMIMDSESMWREGMEKVVPYNRPRLPTEPKMHLMKIGRLESLPIKHEKRMHVSMGPEGRARSGSESESQEKPMSRSVENSPEDGTYTARASSVHFYRSISEFHTASNDNEVEDSNSNMSKKLLRRRNNSGGFGESGLSLLKHPSKAMETLISSLEGGHLAKSLAEKALQRPVMSFIVQRHDLDSLQLAMKQALRKAGCRVYAMQATNWLLRSVTQPSCLHDIMWFFVSSLTTRHGNGDEEDMHDHKDNHHKKELEEKALCEHPQSDIVIGGEAMHPLSTAFHALLQSISDVMMFLPAGSALQQMAVRCWCLKFIQSDHQFLHKCHVFSNISQILSRSDEAEKAPPPGAGKENKSVSCLKDLTLGAECKASSRQAMVPSLMDNSTETFWESGDEDRNRTKSLTLSTIERASIRQIAVHIDNTRDLGNKVTSVTFYSGLNSEDLKKLKQTDLEPRFTGWVSCPVTDTGYTLAKLELKGPDNTLRVRQVKVLGEIDGESCVVPGQKCAYLMQLKNCEMETLKVFRLLTAQVFGRLISDEAPLEEQKKDEVDKGMSEWDTDLKEHMVGILFSRSKLTHLQKQVCTHIVQAIKKETVRVRESWDLQLNQGIMVTEEHNRSSDAYIFELLSMVLALSGSNVGRTFLAQQLGLLQDLLSLLHTATPRVQRQVVSLLRRVLPEVQPQVLARLLNVPSLPPEDFSIIAEAKKGGEEVNLDPTKPGILDVFLICIAKALTVQMKVKGSGKAVNTVDSATSIPTESVQSSSRWWLRGGMNNKLAETIITLLKDMASGQVSEAWGRVTKGAVAENILNLTKMGENLRVPAECIKTPTLWLALASLCVLDHDHVVSLSSGQWISPDGQQGQPRPTCDNHDDGETSAIILCDMCGNLCADCDRFLHLHKRTRSHKRQVFKEEEEAIRVDLHEGCGRTKLFWVMALADSASLKAMVEFREGDRGKTLTSAISTGVCRFCGNQSSTGLLSMGNVCSDPDCQEYAKTACRKVQSCGHMCGGIAGEYPCLPCLHGCKNPGQTHALKQDADDMCMICFTEALSAAPAIQLICSHVFHLHCCRKVLEKGWIGPRITFGFASCPICKREIDHPLLKDLLDPTRKLYDDVKRKALMRLEYEGLHKSEAITTAGARFYNDPAGFAMDRYAYYVCYKCKKAYYGGEARCDEQLEGGDDYDPTELVCGACSDVSRAQMCPKHGTDFLEYKCRYCCSTAVFFCFGTTHFCNACHDDFQRVTNIPRSDLPTCPAGPRGKQLQGDECPLHVKHPPTGEEFALGCGVCRNAHTF
ncbi:E3 ubiquitin-protein ligase MYCBP2 [Lingula anatina]|uniref:RCR-type E3 ubiquitin transferase n=1 Tax=Lingula anatina TaxID=7574 RepID=A0A1S3IPI7_LINAN|nr:E3 ubiquitin-protein ligase MYCBP2 [Lingula anatina]|eukprot:XP_013400127.1 E3 ubiquitin-protein ligase MYCBP2 [Lingula anatina]